MIPAIHSMRFATSPSRSALMIGIPPPTAASNATITSFARAAAKISLPWTARSALLAVTTCLPFAMASSVRSFAMPYPPISSITMSIAGSRTTDHASSVISTSAPVTRRARSWSRSATRVITSGRPTRREISSAFRVSTS